MGRVSQPRAQGRNEERFLTSLEMTPGNSFYKKPAAAPHFSRRSRAEARPLQKRGEVRYSMRRACMGEMEAARLAGMMAAKNEQTASAPAATVNASGSEEETP
jgi:hypothetical protein